MTRQAPIDRDVARHPPGLWQRIEITPLPGVVVARLEDDADRFWLRLAHDGERIVDAVARTERIPWSTCPGAAPLLAEQLVGRALAAVRLFDPMIHCTHLYDLAVLAVAQVGGDRVAYDLHVADRVHGRTTAMLAKDDHIVTRWLLDGTILCEPDAWAGRDLKHLSQWRGSLSPDEAKHAAMLRRAVMVSGVRRSSQTVDRHDDMPIPSRAGACFTYQPSQMARARRSSDWIRDFTASSDTPLGDLCHFPLLASNGPVA